MTSDLRIAVLFDTAGFQRNLPLTGVAARTLHVNAQLAAQGHEVHLFLCDLNPESRPSEAWPMPVTYLSARDIYSDGRRLLHRLQDYRPDLLVMSTTPLVVRYGRRLADDLGCALVYELHDNEQELLSALGSAPEARSRAGALQAAAIVQADGVIAFTDADAHLARSVTDRQVHVIACGVDLGLTPDTIPKERPGSVAFVGHLHYEPNARAVTFLRSVLAPALHSTRQPYSSIDIYGRYPRSLHQQRETPGVHLRGPVPDLHTALSQATVGIAPMDSGGGMKLKVLNYMAAGLPVVASPLAVAGLTDPQRFTLISRPDLSDTTALVRRLLEDEALRTKLGRRGREIAEHSYSWAHIAGAAINAYRDIVDGRPARGGATVTSEATRLLAQEAPIWLREWSGHNSHPPHTRRQMADYADNHSDDAAGRLAHSIDCARLAAEAALGLTFNSQEIVGYAGRSVVFLGDTAVLKVYTHRGAERLRREIAGLTFARQHCDLPVPAVLASSDNPGSLAWVTCERLPGTSADALVTTQQVATALAALHAPGLAGPHTLTLFERSRPAETGNRFLNDEHRALQTVVRELTNAATNFCVAGLVHGDFSRRNLLVHNQLITGLVDFERSGEGCGYEDLATLYLHDGLIDGHDNDELIVCYERSLQTHLAKRITVNRQHLLFHVAAYACWVLQWAAEVDKPLADAVSRLAPAIIGKLNDPHGWIP